MSTNTKHTIDKEYFVKKQSRDDKTGGMWLLLTDDDGQLPALYKGRDVSEGFARVKGKVKIAGEHTYILVSELTPTL